MEYNYMTQKPSVILRVQCNSRRGRSDMTVDCLIDRIWVHINLH